MQLYHNPMSSCSQKVRLVLAEKLLDYESTILDLQRGDQFHPDYRAVNPQAVVPTLIDNDQYIVESTLINEYLEEQYDGIKLMPAEASARHQVRLFTKLLDETLHPACGIISYAIGIRPNLLLLTQAEINNLLDGIPDQARRRDREQVIRHGVKAKNFAKALDSYLKILDRAQDRLKTQHYMVGDDISLADFALLPYIIRLDHLALDNAISCRPLLLEWYKRLQQRASFKIAISDWVPENTVNAFRAAGEKIKNDVYLH